MAAMAASAAGQGGLVVLLNIRPFSESEGGRAEWLQYLREECGSVVAALALETAMRELEDDQYDEWVTATSPRPAWTRCKSPPEKQDNVPGASLA